MDHKKTILLLTILMLGPSFPAWCAKTALTKEDRDTWVLCIKRVKMRPPCCGACKIMTQDESRGVWDYLTSDSFVKRWKGKKYWKEHRVKLLEEFKNMNPERYQVLYGKNDQGGGQ